MCSQQLVDIADNHRWEEDLGEWHCHCVDRRHHGGVHEVDGVAVEEDGGTAHGHADNHRPEYVLEAWGNSGLNIIGVFFWCRDSSKTWEHKCCQAF